MHAFIQDVPIGQDVYAKIQARMGDDPPDGLVVHVALRKPDGTLRYIEIWEDEATCDRAFADRLHPAVFATFKEIGFVPTGEPHREPLDVLHVWRGKGRAKP